MAATAAGARATTKVLFEHDVDCLRNRERYLTARGIFSKLSRYVAWKLEERGQLKAYAAFDSILTLTGFDREQIEGLSRREGIRVPGTEGPPPVHILPTGVDGSFFEAPDVEQESDSILFVGSFAADFNVDAIQHLVESILPRVHQEMPQARLYIAGGNAPPEVQALGRQRGVTYLGLQKDLTGPLASASVFVVPLRFAGGIRIRTLEAMAMGKAIVTTSVGIRGIEAVDGRDLLIADGERDFASAVVGLLRGPERRAQLGRSAREFALKNYGMDVARRKGLELVERLITKE
jgi:glycosyltransferase involved in cell wall biosynthesis